jgi:hypothetical protein
MKMAEGYSSLMFHDISTCVPRALPMFIVDLFLVVVVVVVMVVVVHKFNTSTAEAEAGQPGQQSDF